MRQQQALGVMAGGANVFLTGAPGAGKTYVLNQFIQWAIRDQKTVAVTASTGIAATHIGGMTIHTWAGIGIRDVLSPADIHRMKANATLLKRYNATDVLVIDEVSMLHGIRLTMVDEIARQLRSDSRPFGGMQVVLVGDLFQLPPISAYGQQIDFIYNSPSWEDLDLKICYLTEQHRQQEGDTLLSFLQAMRSGELETIHTEMLQARMSSVIPEGAIVTRLFSHNVDVEALNQGYLAQLKTESKRYVMQARGDKTRAAQLAKNVLAPEQLELKKDAEVMFVANNFAQGYVNGSRGRVIDFKHEAPVVRLYSGKEIVVEPYSWSVSEEDSVRAEVVQLPLRLAWAITIHKSQGMSLDAAEVDLSRAFTPGMGYVALSRVRSADGLYLKGINRQALAMHPQIIDFDAALRAASREIADEQPDFLIADETALRPLVRDEHLFDHLKQWRFQKAQQEVVAPFMVAHNTSLEELATYKPTTERQLLKINGLGPAKIAKYGPELLAVIAAYEATGRDK